MTPEQWNRLKIVFQEALDRPPDVRRAWLEEECAGNQELLREAESLMHSLETADGFLEEPPQVDPAELGTLAPGTRVGAYRIIEEIGRGGMGVVYLAEDERLGRRVALKSLPVGIGADLQLRERLRREARAAATITHPSVAVVYALEEVDGELFIATEYVEGKTLRHLISSGPVGPARARQIAADIAGALAAAHTAGVIHRDLKPDNVLIKADGSVKVVDFGIAQLEGAEVSRLTRTGFALGTPAYMAPEQLVGESVDGRADVYALGIVLSEMLTGRHPLDRSSGPAPTTWLDGTLTGVVEGCLQPDPLNRPTARMLVELLTSQTRSDFPKVGSGPHEPENTAIPEPGNQTGSDFRARWWWEFHQGVTALVYWLMVIPAWYGRGHIGGPLGRAFFVAVLGAVIVSANLRLHRWFTSRFYPAQLPWVHGRSGRWIRWADWAFAAALTMGALLISDERSALTFLLQSVAVGAVVAFLVIEPVTARAAFGPGRHETVS